jgi:hypothetical protein
MSAIDYVSNLANKYIIRTKTPVGINGFVFDYEGETTVNLNSDITDHYTEDNTVINDHIAIRPARVTLRGFVSELSLNRTRTLSGIIEAVSDRLGTVDAYLQDYTPGMVKQMQQTLAAAQNVANTVSQVAERAGNIVGLFANGHPGQTKQSRAFESLESLWKTKQYFELETPYKIYENMVIESIVFMQPDDSKYQSDITVTLKEIRFAKVQVAPYDPANYSGRSISQAAPMKDNGKAKGEEVLQSTLFSLLN